MTTINQRLELKLEMANSMIHGIGVLFGVACIPLLTALATKSNNTPGIVGACVYGFCFLMLFTFSTLYHGFQQPQVKQALKVFDHISIYFLIAGTYTPLILNYLFNGTGIVLLSVLWGLTLIGIFFKLFFVNRFNIISTIIYVLMGWIMVWTGKSFFAAMPVSVIALIIIGGGLYSLGVIFYLWQKWTWHHAIWHLFVLAAAVCHYVAVLITVS
jgi:hemolysin III